MRIGFATIGESPRDDLVPYILEHLSRPVEAVEGGVLDGKSEDDVAALDAGPDARHMVTRRGNARSARLAFDRTLPEMQRVVDRLVADGADLVVVLCGADWSALRSEVPLVNPGRLFPNIIQALGYGRRVGVVKPSDGQVEGTIQQYRALGLDVEVTSAFPYDDRGIERAAAAGARLASSDIDLVWMTCVGMDEPMRQALKAECNKPVVLARSILTKVIDEFVVQS